MHVYVQKSTSTTWPRSPASVSGLSPGVLNQSWLSVKSGAVPRSGSDGVLTPGIATSRSAAVDTGFGRGLLLRGDEAGRRAQRRQSLLDGARVLERARRIDEDRRQARVLGEVLLEADVDVEDHQDPGREQHDAEGAVDRVAASDAADPVDHRASGERVHEQHRGQPDRVGDRDEHHAGVGAARGADRRHRGQDRAGARRAHEPERGADAEPRPEAGTAALRAEAAEPRQRRLDAGRQVGDQQRDAEHDQDHDRQRPRGAAREADALDQLREQHDRDRERDAEPDHDPDRTAAATGGARRQQRRHDRQDARRDRGPRAGDQGKQHQQEHLRPR